MFSKCSNLDNGCIAMAKTRRQAPPKLSGRNTIIAKSYLLPSDIVQYRADPASPVRINTSSISRPPFGVRGMRGHITGGHRRRARQS